MNTHELNQADLNGSFTHNVIVELGTASATIEFVAFERALAFLSGTAGISVGILGDITKYSQIGYASTGIVFNHSATLAAFTEVNIPSGSSSIVFSESGTLYSQQLLPTATGGIDFSVSGDLYVVGDLAGTAALTFSVESSAGPQLTKLLGASASSFALDSTADMTQYIIRYIPDAVTAFEFEADASLTQHVKQYIPASASPMTFDVVGNLTNYAKVYMAGATGITFGESAAIQSTMLIGNAAGGISFVATAEISNRRIDLPEATSTISLAATGNLISRINLPNASTGVAFSQLGNLGVVKSISGSADIVFSTSANLLNNPTAIDPPAYVLTRPFVDRIMVRQS